MLKNEKHENQDTKNKGGKLENGELARLKNHNNNLLTQIKKIKNDKKSLGNKLEQLIEKEASSSKIIQVDEKGTNTDRVNIMTQEDSNLVEVKTYSDVEIQMMGIRSILTNKNSRINKATSRHKEEIISKVNQENATCTIKESHVTKTPYQHPYHESRCINKSIDQHHSGWKQLIYYLKYIDVSTIESHDNQLSQESYKCSIPQRIELGWSDPFIVQ